MSNPYQETIRLVGLNEQSQGRHAWAFLTLKLASTDSTPAATNDPVAESLDRIGGSVGREGFMFKYLNDLLTPYTKSNQG